MTINRLAACLLLATAAAAQSPGFDVVSIKPNPSSDFRNMRMSVLPGRLSVTALPVRVLLVYAYDVPSNPSERLAGVPDWVNREMFDIEAKAPSGVFPAGLPPSEVKAQMQAMVKALLADRFHLAMRAETREMPAYALLAASGGPKLEKAAIEEKDCPMGDFAAATCHQFNGGMGRGMHAKAVNMKDLARFVENWTDLPVVDRTGLDGLYAIETEGWAPMRLPPPPPNAIPPARPSGDGDMSDPGRPTLFVVLRKLGLELKREKAPVTVYTVEHIERPAAN